MINSQFLKLHFSQLVKAWKISKYNSYSDAQKQNYHNNLSELFSCLKKVNFDLQSPTEQQELKEVIDFFILSLQFLNNSTVNCVPYEIVECLKVAMNEWIDKCNNYIIVTSYNQYSFNPYLVVSGPYTIIKTRFNIIFDKKLVQINLPQHLSNDYLCNAVLYHELGHFVGFIAGNVDRNNEFLAIYSREKDNYTKLSKPYVCQNSSEFFAECYGLYITDPAYLKKNLPYSYNYIIQSIRKIDKTRVAKVKEAYAPYWKY